MNYLSLSFQRIFIRDDKVSAFSLGALMLLAIIGMGLFSLTTFSNKASKGYLVNKLESERQELVQDGEVTDMLILRARSYENIESSEIVRRMRKASRDEIAYVTPIQVMAKK